MNLLRRIQIAAKFIGHGPCGFCGSRDNRANYSDGGWFCFGCRKSGRGTQSGFVTERNSADATGSGTDAGEPVLLCPADCGHDFPEHCQRFLAQYAVSIPMAIQRGLQYSAYYDQLIYEYKDKDGITKCIQARNFNPDRAAKAKYFNQGSTSEVLPIYKVQEPSIGTVSGSKWKRRLVITEDALSAIRIASQCDAMPALGTNVPAHKIIALKARQSGGTEPYEFITIWLDRDKWREAREIAEKCLWVGLSANTVFTEQDPKSYTDQEITRYLT